MAPAAIVIAAAAWAVSSVNRPPEIAPKRSVSVPDPVGAVAEAKAWLASVCCRASAVTSSEKVPLGWREPESAALATAALAICGCGERSPWRTRWPSEVARPWIMFLRLEAAVICKSSSSALAVSRSCLGANCALARLFASDIMSIPLPPPSAATSEVVAPEEDVTETMRIRTAFAGSG